MKKAVAFFVLCIFAVFMAVDAFGAFSDVSEGDYYASAAAAMAERGILSGYGDGNFHGDEAVTRAQIAALVCKMLNRADDAAALAGKTAFSDVGDGAWYTGYINYAVANGIISGDGNGKFRPDDYVKYEEVVKVAVCVLGLDGDVEIDKNDWSKEYIEVADGVGLTANLLGEKGTPMKRSDIAVITAAAMKILDAKAENTTRENQLPLIWFE